MGVRAHRRVTRRLAALERSGGAVILPEHVRRRLPRRAQAEIADRFAKVGPRDIVVLPPRPTVATLDGPELDRLLAETHGRPKPRRTSPPLGYGYRPTGGQVEPDRAVYPRPAPRPPSGPGAVSSRSRR